MTPDAVLLGPALWLVPVLAVGRAGSKPGMVLGTVTGFLFAVLAAVLGPAVGIAGTDALVVAVPAAFVLGFLVVGGGIALVQNLS